MQSRQSFNQQILELLAVIPRGKVVTYGQIAAMLGRPRAARAVGNILHRNLEPERFPCYKVVNAAGQLSCHYAFGGINGQQQRLERDGIIVQDGRIDLRRYQISSDELAQLLDL